MRSYAKIANATAAPPNAHILSPVIAGMPPVLTLVEVVEVWTALLPLPLDVVVLPPDVEAIVVDVPELVVVAGAKLGVVALPPTARPVTRTGIKGISVPVYVSVLSPGKFASSPLKDSIQTADMVPAREQSM